MKYKICFFAALVCMASVLFTQDRGSTVYVTDNGKKYHTQYCRTLQKCESPTPMTVEEAVQQGYSPCKICKP